MDRVQFKLNPVGSSVANVFDVVLNDPAEVDSKDTRRILRPRIVQNIHNPEASVQATIIHQRRHKRSEPWQDADSFSLSKLHGGEMAKLELSARQTRRLYEALTKLYKISPGGWSKGSEQNVVIIEGSDDPDVSELLHMVLDAFKQGGKPLFKRIVEAEPDLCSNCGDHGAPSGAHGRSS